MFPHWNYVLENLFGRVESVYARAVTEIPERVDEKGQPYPATADDAAYAIFELEGGVIAQLNSSWTTRVNRDELVEFQVDGTHGSAPSSGSSAARSSRATPRRSRCGTPTSPTRTTTTATGSRCPTNDEFENGFKTQWEEFIRHVVEDAPNHFDFLAGARGVLLAEEGLESLRRGPPHRPARRHARARPTDAASAADAAAPASTRPPSSPGRADHDRDHPHRRHRRPARRAARRGAGVPQAAASAHEPGRLRGRARGAEAVRRQHARRSRPRSTGTPRSPSATTSGRGGSASPTPWTPRSATWASTPSATRELISRSAAEAASVGGDLVVGVNTDHVDDESISLEQVIDAYKEQLHHAEDAGRRRRADGEPAPRPRRAHRRRLPPRLPRGARARPAARSSCTGSAPRSTRQLAGYFGSDDTDAAGSDAAADHRVQPRQGLGASR